MASNTHNEIHKQKILFDIIHKEVISFYIEEIWIQNRKFIQTKNPTPTRKLLKLGKFPSKIQIQ